MASSESMSSLETAIAAATTAATDAANNSSSSWLGLFGRMILFIIQALSTLLYWSLKLTTISVPTLLFQLFSTNLTVTMNATTLALILTAVMSAVTWIVRYRYLNMYSRLPPEPQRKEPDLDLPPDSHEEGDKPGLTNYLDEFLSAIKIFGYLDRPVFHELTRSMQTRKLIAGETLNLEDEQGFCLVVDGLVEIFVKSLTQNQGMDGTDSEDEHHQPYQLLTEVRNGAPMSSLFSIMSLFTEDVRLRLPVDGNSTSRAAFNSRHHPSSAGLGHSRQMSDSFPSTPHLDNDNDDKRASIVEEPQVIPVGSPNGSYFQQRIPHMSLDEPSQGSRPPTRPHPKRMATNSVHPDIVARATVDTTIAIIPANAFRRLIKMYPKSTAHIVHVILSRFQRVTLATAYNYLGLTHEVLHIEKEMVNYTTCQLPNILRGDALDRLKEKFAQEKERTSQEDSGKGIALHNASATAHRRRRSSTGLRRDATVQALAKARNTSMVASTIVPPQERSSLHTAGPGDLLANIQSARGSGSRVPGTIDIPLTQPWQSRESATPLEARTPLAHRVFDPFSQKRARISIDPRESVDEDNMFRVSILECVFTALGMSSGDNSSRGPGSVEASPRLISYDRQRQRAVFSNNAFGFMDSFDGGTDWDAESMTSGGISMATTPSANLLASELKHEVEIVFFPQGSVLVEPGERCPGIYYVIDGFLDMGVSDNDTSSEILSSASKMSLSAMHREDSHASHRRTATLPGNGVDANVGAPEGKMKSKPGRRSVGLVKPGGIAGYIGTVSSYRSFIDVVAKTDVYVGFIPRMMLERIVERYPIVLLTMAKRLINVLPRLILHIDFALEWVQVNAGQVIFHKDEESEAIYLVLNGRLRLIEDRRGGGHNVRAEFGQGDSVGELEVLTESTRSGTLHAIRDTELVKFPRTLFNSLAQEHPNITIKISKIIASRMRTLVDDPSKAVSKESSGGNSLNKISSILNLRTVAILPVTSGVPVVEFGNRLMNALTQVGAPGGATSLNQSAILNHLGKHAFNRMGKLKLSHYLADLEEKYGLVIYVADTNVNSPWTQTCITQADCILLVGLAEGSPEIGEYERYMLGQKSTARKILVLLHDERYSPPGLTRAWLRNRVWINGGHFHIQMDFKPTEVPVHPRSGRRLGATLKERVQVIQAEIQKYTGRKVRHTPYYSPDAPFKGDFHRLARRLCGKSIGLVLGGGGARGITQVGIIKALEEAGIPIDVVGGTSIGAFIGALYARHADVVPMFGLAKKFAGRMSSMWRFALDLTYPSASYTTGHEFNRGIFKTFGNHQIEDFWLEYYCNTTNISKSRGEIHTSGYAWRYVRASMSLAGLLPPLCDEGSMLLDGGYIDNLTVSHMKSVGADVIFAIDVGALDDDTPQAYGDTLSGVWAFVNRWNPFSSIPNPPTLAEIQGRLAYVSSVDALERAKTMPGCVYMRPPIDDYGTLDFGKFDELYEMGYRYGMETLARLREEGVLPLVEETEAKKALRRTMAPRRASI